MASNDDILLRIGADVSDLKRGLAESRKEVSSTGKVVDDLKGQLLGVAGVLGLGLGFSKLVGDAIQFADAIQKAADQTGMAAEDVQYLRYAADQCGSSVEGMTNLVGKMQTQLVEAAKGNKEINTTLTDLGLNLESLRAMNPNEQFSTIATAIAGIKDPGEQAAAAVELLGKSGKDALPLIKTFAEGQEEIRANFEAMGGPVSADAVKAVDDMGDAASGTALGIKMATTELVAMVAPIITDGLKALTSLIGAIRGEAEPAADSLEGLNKKLAELYAIQQQGAFRDAGMGLTIGKSPQEMAALQAEIDALKKRIQTERELLELGSQAHVLVAEELADITIIDEARAAALEKERLLIETRRIMKEAERAGELAATQAHIDQIVEEYSRGAEFTNQEEMTLLDESALYHAQTWDKKAQGVTDSLVSMTAGVARESKVMFEINKAAALAGAVVNTAQGITQALGNYPPPVSFAMAAAQAAAGAAQISQISKAKFGSGAVPSQAATAPVPVTNTGGQGNGGGQGGGGVMRVEGITADSLLTGKMVRSLADRLSDHVRDGGRVEWAQ